MPGKDCIDLQQAYEEAELAYEDALQQEEDARLSMAKELAGALLGAGATVVCFVATAPATLTASTAGCVLAGAAVANNAVGLVPAEHAVERAEAAREAAQARRDVAKEAYWDCLRGEDEDAPAEGDDDGPIEFTEEEADSIHDDEGGIEFTEEEADSIHDEDEDDSGEDEDGDEEDLEEGEDGECECEEGDGRDEVQDFSESEEAEDAEAMSFYDPEAAP